MSSDREPPGRRAEAGTSKFVARKVEEMLAILKPAPGGEKWPCGHPKTAKNTAPVGTAGNRCRTCRRKTSRESWRRTHQTSRKGGAGHD